MAKYNVTFSCGHDEIVELVGKVSKREWQIRQYEETGLCSECYTKEEEKKRKKAYEEAMAEAKEMGLPDLVGTEKQVEWAMVIRQEMIEILEKRKHRPRRPEMLEYMTMQITNAAWYIEYRDQSYYIDEVLAEMKIPSKEELVEKEREKELRVESTAYPENCEYTAPAEIEVTQDRVAVSFEKNDTFRAVVKDLGYKWDSGAMQWYRKIGPITGSAPDRAAELGNKLLNAGFPISILDKETLKRAIDADYEPEHDRWILLRTSGEYKGWLSIRWAGHNDHVYSKARSLPNSRWSKPSVVVKADYWQEVLDFADMMGFKVSPAAWGRIEEVKAIQQAARVVKPAEPKEKEEVNKLEDILKSSPEVLDDLKEGD